MQPIKLDDDVKTLLMERMEEIRKADEAKQKRIESTMKLVSRAYGLPEGDFVFLSVAVEKGDWYIFDGRTHTWDPNAGKIVEYAGIPEVEGDYDVLDKPAPVEDVEPVGGA